MNFIILLQYILAFAIGIFSLFMIYKLMNYFLKRMYHLEDKNLSFAIFQSGIILSCAMILSSVIDPAINVIRIMNPSDQVIIESLIHSIGFVVLFVLIGITTTIVTVVSGLISIFLLTKIDEIEEIKNNNIAVAILTISFIIGISMIIDNYVGGLCEMLIPYPEVLNIG